MDSSQQKPVKIGEIYKGGELCLSVEIFPPKTSDGDDALFRSLDRLSQYKPAFISCTFGAGGSTQARTAELCIEIQKRYQLAATSHLTCVGSTTGELIDWITQLHENGVRNIMALRGDPPAGEESFQKVEGGLSFANELVELIREHHPEMGIGVAGYPEKHQECSDAETDLLNLKRKVEAGADAVFTQLFFDNDHFFDFRDRYEECGIQVPLIPGIMPVTNFARIQRITAMCGASFPEELATKLEAAQDDTQAQFEIGVEHAIQQCQGLIAQNVPGIHFYVLNRSKACERILEGLDYQPAQADCA